MTTKGVDVSSWSHPNGQAIDWAAVKANGAQFAIVKLTQSDTYLNPYAAQDVVSARAAGLAVGLYHYVDPTISAQANIDWFAAHARSLNVDLPCFLDMEVESSDWAVTATLRDAMLAAAKGSVLPFAAETGVYCNDSFFTGMGNNATAPLWYASPNPGQASQPAGSPTNLLCVQTAQNLTGQPGIPGTVDANEWTGVWPWVPTTTTSAPTPTPTDLAPVLDQVAAQVAAILPLVQAHSNSLTVMQETLAAGFTLQGTVK